MVHNVEAENSNISFLANLFSVFIIFLYLLVGFISRKKKILMLDLFMEAGCEKNYVIHLKSFLLTSAPLASLIPLKEFIPCH